MKEQYYERYFILGNGGQWCIFLKVTPTRTIVVKQNRHYLSTSTPFWNLTACLAAVETGYLKEVEKEELALMYGFIG